MTQTILILGATSAIARAVAKLFAARGHALYLASRDEAELARIATDLKIRYNISVYYDRFDAEDLSNHASFFQKALDTLGKIDGVLLAFGGENKNAEKTIAGNFTGAVSILNHCADYFTQQRQGFIIGISSVAGDRGRQSNYIYGAAKAGLTTYLQGLRNKLFPVGVRVITIKAGFVDTPLTFGLPGLFWVASPHRVAKSILTALDKSHDVIYTPWFWRYIMLIIRVIPEKIFKRLKL